MKNVLNKNLFKYNKDFSANHRDSTAFHYLYTTNLLNLINSMFLITKNFKNVVYMGNNPDLFLERLPRIFDIETLIYCDISEKNINKSKQRIDEFIKKSENIKLPKNIFPLLINQDKWPFKENSIDCIVNNLYLHNVEDLDSHLKLVNDSLVPDGCLLTNFFSTSTLKELKFVMGLAESEREGGVSTNALTFPHISDIGNILHKYNMSLPSMSIYKYLYKFDDLAGLFEFLEIIGETNTLMNRRPFKRRDTYIAAMAIYQNLYNNKRLADEQYMDLRTIHVDLRENTNDLDFVYSTIEVGSLVCWKYHKSQQKPKERGSAEFDLKELASDVLESGKDDIRFGSVSLKEGTEEEFEIVEMTEMIKEKIRNKLGEEAVKEKIKKKNEEISKPEENEK